MQTASGHLSKLGAGGLLRPRKQGRHKYYTIASDDVAAVLEALMGLAAGAGHLRRQTGPKDAALRHARVCYNHLAGDRGTQLFDALVARGALTVTDDLPTLTPTGAALIATFGIDLAPLQRARAPLCRSCLDWSARRSHLAGSLGRAFLHRFTDLGWVTCDPKTRVVTFSNAGDSGFADLIAPR